MPLVSTLYAPFINRRIAFVPEIIRVGFNNILFCLNIQIIYKHNISLNYYDSKLQKLLSSLVMSRVMGNPVLFCVCFFAYAKKQRRRSATRLHATYM